jgi:inosine-uridine nucleoside N-ribohydrolase
MDRKRGQRDSRGPLQRVYMDIDPGHDDAFALVAALKRFRVAGVTTVAGNSTVDKTFLNARRVLTVAEELEVPVLKGSARPLQRPLFTGEYVHGHSGLDGHEFGPPRSNAIRGDAVRWLARRLEAEAEKVTLIATGPLTNVGRLLRDFPESKKKLSRIVIMGGAFWSRGNVTEHAEFNIYVDPEAASLVAKSDIPLWAVGLDATHKALFPKKDIPNLRRVRHPVGAMLANLMTFYGDYQWMKGKEDFPVHDLLAVYAACEPDQFEWVNGEIVVDTTSERRGKTTLNALPAGGNASAARDIHVGAFLEWVWQTMKLYE